jgi:integrase
VSTTRRRGNSEGSNPVQRGDGRWQVHIRHTDEDGRSRRYTVYGSTPKEARTKASAVRERLRAKLPAKDRKITLGAFAAVDRLNVGGVGSQSVHKGDVRDDGPAAHQR